MFTNAKLRPTINYPDAPGGNRATNTSNTCSPAMVIKLLGCEFA